MEIRRLKGIADLITGDLTERDVDLLVRMLTGVDINDLESDMEPIGAMDRRSRRLAQDTQLDRNTGDFNNRFPEAAHISTNLFR